MRLALHLPDLLLRTAGLRPTSPSEDRRCGHHGDQEDHYYTVTCHLLSPLRLSILAAYGKVGWRRIHAAHPPSFLSIGSQAGRGTGGTVGVVAPGSSAPFSSCFLCVRDKCAGPAKMTTTIATTHHVAASIHDCLTESAPENMGEKNWPEMVLFIACIIMMISTLPLALLKTQLKMITAPMISTMSDQWTSPTTISGTCHPAMSTPRIRAAKSAERPACRRGSAKPLQPGSSHAPPRPGIRSAMAKPGKRFVQPPRSAAEGAWAPSRTLSTVATRASPAGSKRATAYHPSPTRQRTIRLSRAPIPLLPWVMASTRRAARKGAKLKTGAMG